jgi:hypothetical protein
MRRMTMNNLTDKDLGPEGVLGSRGITDPEVIKVAFTRYLPGDPDRTIARWLHVGPPDDQDQVAKRYEVAVERSWRAPGVYLRKFPVPEGDPFCYAEVKPDWEIWSGEWPRAHDHSRHYYPTKEELEAHLADDKVTREKVVKGTTPEELDKLKEAFGRAWEVTGGADHGGVEIGRRVRHVHLPLPKYLFVGNQRVKVEFEHDHVETPIRTPVGTPELTSSRWDMWQGFRTVESHLRLEHGYPRTTYSWKKVPASARKAFAPFEHTTLVKERTIPFTTWNERGVPHPKKRHVHKIVRDDTRYAKRLSSHPLGFGRIEDADIMWWVLENSLKEAVLVQDGMATFCSPSVSLWEAEELGDFAKANLVGKLVLVLCDNDYQPGVGKRRKDDDSVIRQVLTARDTLRSYGVRAWAVAPPVGPFKGIDDFRAAGGSLPDLVVFDRVPETELEDWIVLMGLRQVDGRRVNERTRKNAVAVWRWLSTHADARGRSRVGVRALGARLLKERKIEVKADAKDPYTAAANKVSRTIDNLVEWGVVEKKDLKKRRGHQGRPGQPWEGHIVIVPKKLRSKTITQRLGDLVDVREAELVAVER